MSVKHIDSYKLIDAVSKRPALYDKGNQMYYCHNKFKQRLWKETCEEVYAGWDTMSTHKRTEYGRELQKRWKNLRTCFAREVALQKKEHQDRKERREVKHRKRYEYFNRMLFLLNDAERKTIEYIMSYDQYDHADDEETEIPIDTVKTETNEDFGEDENIMVIEPEPYRLTENVKNVDVDLRSSENVNNIDVHFNVNDGDDDKLFLMSLLRTFRQFDDRQKFAAKIQILATLRKIQFPED